MFLTVKNMDILSTLFTLNYCFVLFTEIKLNRYGLPKFNILSHKVLNTTFKYLDKFIAMLLMTILFLPAVQEQMIKIAYKK